MSTTAPPERDDRAPDRCAVTHEHLGHRCQLPADGHSYHGTRTTYGEIHWHADAAGDTPPTPSSPPQPAFVPADIVEGLAASAARMRQERNEARAQRDAAARAEEVAITRATTAEEALERLRGEVERLVAERAAQANRLGPPTDKTSGPDRVAWLLCDEDVTRLGAALAATAPQTAPASPPQATQAIDVEHLSRQRDWSRETFGPGRRTQGVIDHIRKELNEIEADPTDLVEWVDVIILAFDGAWRAGWEADQIIAAIKDKQSVNEARTWPDWRTRSESEAIEHDREPTPSDQGPPELTPAEMDAATAAMASLADAYADALLADQGPVRETAGEVDEELDEALAEAAGALDWAANGISLARSVAKSLTRPAAADEHLQALRDELAEARQILERVSRERDKALQSLYEARREAERLRASFENAATAWEREAEEAIERRDESDLASSRRRHEAVAYAYRACAHAARARLLSPPAETPTTGGETSG